MIDAAAAVRTLYRPSLSCSLQRILQDCRCVSIAKYAKMHATSAHITYELFVFVSSFKFLLSTKNSLASCVCLLVHLLYLTVLSRSQRIAIISSQTALSASLCEGLLSVVLPAL